MATVLPLVGVAGGFSASAVLTVNPTIDAGAATGDDLFFHIMFPTAGVTVSDPGEWNLIAQVDGPDYTSFVYHDTHDGTLDLDITWSPASTFTYQTIALDPLDTPTQVNSDSSLATLGSAVLPRLTGLPDPETIHMLCFAGSLNTASKLTANVRTDVGWLLTRDIEDPDTAGLPVLWVGDFPGPLGDSDVTLTSAVYFDPPPSHSVGHTLALNLA